MAPTLWGTTNNKQEIVQTVLIITKALTKTTNCALRAKKCFPSALRRISAPSPHFEIRSGATEYTNGFGLSGQQHLQIFLRE